MLAAIHALVSRLAITHIHSYLVHPSKDTKGPKAIGGQVDLTGKAFDLLHEIYSRSDTDCDIDISFNRRADGKQQNPCRDLLMEYVKGPTKIRGGRIAERLANVTTHRSGLGLLFLIAGKEGRNEKLVVSRFPADSGLLADDDQKTLSVSFIDKIFMKNSYAYKAASYQDTSLAAGFWMGRATDKQIGARIAPLSNYWIADFLDSDFRTTAAAGTRRLAVALRNAIMRVDTVATKSEIAAAATLARSLQGQRISIGSFENRFGLSPEACEAIMSQLNHADLVDEQFQFDEEEFSKHVAFRTVELDSGGWLAAEASEFDRVFTKSIVDPEKGKVKFTAEGKIVREKVGKAR